MKYMIASDIHGSEVYCKHVLNRFREENADRLILLGDLLYHGPRNELPDGYAPKAVIELLNEVKDSVFCVRGNCDAEVDQMVLAFPIMADYALLSIGSNVIYMTHGHLKGESDPPALKKGDYLLCGHTHVPACNDHGHYTYLNPGSVSIPKENSCHSYMTFDETCFKWKNVETGEMYNELHI